MVATRAWVFFLTIGAGAGADLRVLDPSPPPSSLVYAFFERLAKEQLAARRSAIGRIGSQTEAEARGQWARDTLRRLMGGLPEERTPLNLQRRGQVDRGAYRLEKIAFESQPRFFVTANLYIPQIGRPPYPAVLQPTGHSLTAKSRELYQRLSIGLAHYGFVVLTYDPLGQGERRIFYDAELRDSKVGSTTVEHQMVGIQALLGGESLARMMVWDAIRGLDVLASLPEVDPQKLGIAGCSGGGTVTAYVAALDERVQAAAPACYMSSWEEQLAGTGPQDAEQQFPDQLRAGFDHADFVWAFAPKPYLICSTTQDFFPLAGARRTYEEGRQAYARLGAADRLGWFSGPGGHGMRADTRAAIYAFFRQWLKGEPPGAAPEPPHRIELDEDLQATPTGQVATSLGGETASELQRRRLAAIPRPAPGDVAALIPEVTRASPSAGELRLRRVGQAQAGEYRVEKLIFEGEPGLPVPALLYHPRQRRRPPVLYADAAGKDAPDAAALAQRGHPVLAVDLAGAGETATRRDSYSATWFPQDKTIWLALMTGRTLTGVRITEIRRALEVMRAVGLEGGIVGVGKGGLAIPLLHAAVLEPRVRELYLEETLVSYRALARAPVHRQVFDLVLPGVLRAYDLDDLVSALAPRRVRLVNLCNALGQPLPAGEVEEWYARARERYRAAGAAGHFEIGRRREGEALADVGADR